MIDSDTVAIVSLVSPFKLVISSDKMLEIIPGALSFRSNHEIYL